MCACLSGTASAWFWYVDWDWFTHKGHASLLALVLLIVFTTCFWLCMVLAYLNWAERQPQPVEEEQSTAKPATANKGTFELAQSAARISKRLDGARPRQLQAA